MTSVHAKRYGWQVFFGIALIIVLIPTLLCCANGDDKAKTADPADVQPGASCCAVDDTKADDDAKADDDTKAADDAKADDDTEAADDAKADDDTETELAKIPTVKWILKPVPMDNAEAKTEADMKAYTQKVPGTEEKFEMVPIRGGKFLMGSPGSEEDRGEDEGPQHEVVIEPFWMGKCEVTWGEYEQWAEALDKNYRKYTKVKSTKYDEQADNITLTGPTPPYQDMTFGMGKEGYPAICMTQLSAKMYCKWLSAKTGHYYRLPTEAEWEYACRAGTKTAYSFGDNADDIDDYAWHYDNSDEKYHKVGKKKPNPWGLHDMHGNVCEWVLDKYLPDFYARSKGKVVKNPLISPDETYPRAVRGGSWDDDPEDLRSSARRGSESAWKDLDPQAPQSIWYHTDANFLGFRVVRPLVKPTAEQAKIYEPEVDVIEDYAEAKDG